MTTEQRYEKTFETGDRCELTLTNVRGSVRVLGWDRPEVSVEAVKRLGTYMGAQQAFDETVVTMDQQGQAVRLRTRSTRGFNPFSWIGLGMTPPEVDYTVQVPRQGEVAVRCVSGPLEIKDIAGSIYARTVNGDIFLERLSGSIIVHGVNGRCRGQEITGQLGARTVDSDIGILQSRLSSLSAKTVSGSVTLESPLAADGVYSVQTVSGDLHLYLAAGAGAILQLESVSGRIQSDLPVQLGDQRRGHARATLNGGGPLVELHSVSGSLLVGLAGQAHETTPEPAHSEPSGAEPRPAAGAPAGETPELDVLRAVERGDMTVDEALKRLEGLMGQ